MSGLVGRAKEALYGFHHRAVHVPRVRRIGRAIAALVGPASSLLDVGAGDGTLAELVGREVGAERVRGVDVLVRPAARIPVELYDGASLPFPDAAFDVVILSDVLHHCEDPRRVLRECLRVARRAVGLKDHFRFGPLSTRILLAMDRVGNAAPGVKVLGTYFDAREWHEIVEAAGGRFAALVWPLRIHDLPFRLVTRDTLQFAARIEPADRGARP
jgi:SAM-dependent methyltransferase